MEWPTLCTMIGSLGSVYGGLLWMILLSFRSTPALPSKQKNDLPLPSSHKKIVRKKKHR